MSEGNPPAPPAQSPAEQFFTTCIEDITARRQVVGLYLPGHEAHYAVRESWLAQLAKGHVEPAEFYDQCLNAPMLNVGTLIAATVTMRS